MTSHNSLIAIHALAGIAAFVLGYFVVRPAPRTQPAGALFRAYQTALLLMLVFLVLTVAVDWIGLSTGTRLIYAALIVLGGYMLWRAWRAGSTQTASSSNWPATYVDDVGFTLIALFDGFVIIAAIDLGAPVWAVTVIAILGVVAGRWAIGRVKQSLRPV